MKPGTLHTVTAGSNGFLGLYRLELQVIAGSGKLTISGVESNSKTREAIKVAYDYYKANMTRVSSAGKPLEHDYHVHIVELHHTGAAAAMTLVSFISLCSGLLGKPVQTSMVVLGNMSLGGSIITGENLDACLQMAFDSGARKLLLPMCSVRDIPTIPGELFAKFQTSFYADPVDAVFKALGVE